MPGESVEPMIRAGFAAFNRGDYEAATAIFHPDVEWIAYLGALEGHSYKGPAAIAAMWSTLEESFGGSLRLEVQEVIETSEQVVVVVVEAHAMGATSGAEVTQRWAMLARLREGLVVRIEPFADRETAMEAARPAG